MRGDWFEDGHVSDVHERRVFVEIHGIEMDNPTLDSEIH